MIKNKKGFTLIELLAVIVVIGIIVTISVGSIINYLSGSNDDLVSIQEKNINSGAEAYFNDNLGLFTRKNTPSICSDTTYDEGIISRICTISSNILVSGNYIEHPKNLQTKKDILYDITINFTLENGMVKNLKFSSESFDYPVDSEGNPIPTFIDKSNANKPVLADGMIPVVYDEKNDVWIKASEKAGYYAYQDQMWANAVTVDSCIPKGDINLDGSITQEDAQLVLSYSAQNVVDYTEEEMLLRGDINGDGKIQFRDATMILNVASDPDKYKLTYNLCTSPAKDPSVSKSRVDYESAEAGTVIAMEDINAMWVWIPRFKYKITSGLGSSSSLTNPPQIDVVFESGTNTTGVDEATYRTGITSTGTNTNYYTHPAFTFGSENLSGFWVGKFETGTSNSTCNSSPSADNCKEVDPIIKPDVPALRYQNISTQFLTSLKFAGGVMDTTSGAVTFSGNDKYGFANTTDSHMMKNTEWGAVAYLTQSKYGKMGNNDYTGTNKEVYVNNNNRAYTGRSGGTPIKTNGLYGNFSYNDKSACSYDVCAGSKTANAGTGASTTGTIYGIYDMNGGSNEYVMASWKNYTGFNLEWNSGFNGLYTTGAEKIDGISFPQEKYYNLYTGTSSNSITKEKAILGDATWETMNWYSDGIKFAYNTYPWTSRGGYFGTTTYSGIFSSYYIDGVSYSVGNANSAYSFRTVLVP